MSVSGAPTRLGVFDGGRVLPPALTRRLDGAGWQYRLMGSAVPPEDLVPMRLDALVIDLAVLGPQAWSYLEQICLHVPQLGVIVCTGPSTVAQRVRALRLGVDDWLSKPCHPAELIARVEAVMRRGSRGSREAPTEAVSSGEIEILPGHFQATVADAALELTRREF
jgi:DNA-binding response OmpR family regulator